MNFQNAVSFDRKGIVKKCFDFWHPCGEFFQKP